MGIKELLTKCAEKTIDADRSVRKDVFLKTLENEARKQLGAARVNYYKANFGAKLDSINIPFESMYEVAPWLEPHAKHIWELFKGAVTNTCTDPLIHFIDNFEERVEELTATA